MTQVLLSKETRGRDVCQRESSTVLLQYVSSNIITASRKKYSPPRTRVARSLARLQKTLYAGPPPPCSVRPTQLVTLVQRVAPSHVQHQRGCLILFFRNISFFFKGGFACANMLFLLCGFSLLFVSSICFYFT